MNCKFVAKMFELTQITTCQSEMDHGQEKGLKGVMRIP
jgi:hypothetical protein